VRRWLVVLVLLAPARARALDFRRPLRELQITTWDRSRGLPSSFVTALAQTPDGYVWIGTNRGLVRFDGTRFRTFRHADEPGLPSDYVNALAIGAGGLWIGTATGLARWRDGALSAFGAAHGLPAENVAAVVEDRAGHVWAAAGDALYRLDGDRFVALAGVRAVSGLLEARDGTVWIAGQSLARWRGGRVDAPAAWPAVAHVAEGADGTIFAVAMDELIAVRGDALEHTALPRDLHGELRVDADGAVWLTSSGGGLVRRRPDGTAESLSKDTGLPAANVTTLLFDREGSVWLGTSGGLVRLGDARATTFALGPNVPVTPFEEDAGGTMWLGTPDGLSSLAGGRVAAVAGAPKNVVSAHVDRRGRLWVGATDGVYLRDGGGFRRLTDDLLFAAADDGADGVWLATNRGAVHWTDAGAERTRKAQGLADEVVAALLPARDGSVWLGTRAGACRLAAGGPPRCFRADEGGPAAKVLALHEDATGTIWLGTHEGGLYRYRDGRFVRFGTEHGLPSNSHFAVVEDGRGRLWTSSDVGIARIELASLERVAAGTAARVDVRAYDERDGMRSADCLGVGVTGLRARDGRLWFGTTDGAAVIDPAAADPRPPVPAAVLDRASYAGAVVPATGALELPAGTDRFALQFAAPTMEWGPDVSFRYRLAGLDREWIETADATASYTNVPPGSYRFAVAARVGRGDFGPAAELAVTVLPRLWQTGAFRVAVAAAALALVVALARWRLAAIARRQRELEALVAARTRDLAAAKDALEQANATLEERVDAAVRSLREAERMAAYGQMVAGVAHEVRQPIFALGTAAHVLHQKLADRDDVARQVALVQRETKRMNAIMDELLDFARPPGLVKTPVRPKAVLAEAADIFAAEPGDAVAVRVEAGDLAPVPLDEARMVQVLVNLMGNARKHAAGLTRIVLRASVADGKLRIDVDNDGAGIPADVVPSIFEPFFSRGKGKGTGLGLAIVKRIVAEHGGDIRVAAGDAGTCFTIEVPAA
jgi:signal transduction histidine kinase/ligand-binding sensor domain-containing protein